MSFASSSDDPRVRALVSQWTDGDGLVDVFDFAEALRIEPHETRYRAIAFAERFLGKAPIGDAAGEMPGKGFKGLIWRLLLGRSGNLTKSILFYSPAPTIPPWSE